MPNNDSNNNSGIKHFSISFFALGIAIVVAYFSPSITKWLISYFEARYGGDLPTDLAYFTIIRLLLVMVGVLISYVTYLLLSYNTRTELVAVARTRSLSLTLEEFMDIYIDAPVPYVTLDISGKVLNPNKAAIRFFEAVTEDIMGKNFFGYYAGDNAEKAEKLLRYYYAKIPINREELMLVTKSGKVRWALLSVFYTRDPARLNYTGLATIFDITEEKQLDKAKTEFVSLASHQLRTPAATIKWYSDSLISGLAGELLPKQREYIENMYKVNENNIELIETLLSVSRIEAGTLKIDSGSTNVPNIVESVLLELGSQIEGKHIIIDKNYGGNLEDIKSDPKLLRIVVSNIISNAVKYTPDGGRVVIELKESFNNKAIIVTDTGIGIPVDEQDKIFTKLFRAENARAWSGAQGIGLGLYMVKSIMESLGGSIQFTSLEGKGTEFIIKI